MRQRTLDFSDHRRALGDNAYVYPVVSRRSKGLSVGVNLNPDGVCNFDCPYCQVDRRQAPLVVDVDLGLLERELDSLLGLAASGRLWVTPPFDTTAQQLRRVNDVAFAGDGEPTAFGGFHEALRIAGRLLQRHGLDEVTPVVLTNATLLHRPAVAEALRTLDDLGGRVWAKLDAGTEAWFQFVAGTTTPLSRILRNLESCAEERPLVIQSMFLRFLGTGPSSAELDAWSDNLARIADRGPIELVQVYSIARPPARHGFTCLPRPELDDIAARVSAIGLCVEVFEGRATKESS